MTPFKDHASKTWDLDDPITYTESWFARIQNPVTDAHTTDDLRVRIETEVGMSLYYMECWAPDVPWGDQRDRVTAFGRRFAQEIKERREDRIWLLGQLFLILDETENQC